MPIIAVVGRKSLKSKLLFALLYIFCVLGAVIFTYPFLLMLSSSTTNSVDYDEFKLVPRFYFDDDALYRKYLNLKYTDRYRGGEKNILPLNSLYKTDFPAYKDITPVYPDVSGKGAKARLTDYEQFLSQLAPEYWTRGFNYDLLKDYRSEEKTRFKDIERLNNGYAETLSSFEFLLFPVDEPLTRSWKPVRESAKWINYLKFKAKLPPSHRIPALLEKRYTEYLKLSLYIEIGKLNYEWGTTYKTFDEIRLPETLPVNPKEAACWRAYVRSKIPYRFMKLSGNSTAYVSFLKNKYGNVGRFNRYYKTTYSSIGEAKLPEFEPAGDGQPKLDWRNYCDTTAPVQSIHIFDSSQKYAEFLSSLYGRPENMNRAYGTSYKSFSEAPMPVREEDRSYFLSHKQGLRFGFIINNYSDVLSYMLLNGRASVNTVILVLAMLLTSLTVNPLCAYALSRYNLPYAYRILLFLLATMAFPAEVGMIPGFLLLKQLGFLNTFWALILPGMASGYNIFILKGFFDSLPKDLYESADLDGASEAQMFWHITLPLSKPVFAVIALWTFVSTYGGFMWAFIICQDPKMWTIMVSIYQFQQSSGANGQHLVMAALTFAALPVLLVFIFAQKIIMQGIILPVEK